MTADLSSLAQVRRLAGEVVARHERLDVLVNNAGVISVRPQLTADGLETKARPAKRPGERRPVRRAVVGPQRRTGRPVSATI